MCDSLTILITRYKNFKFETTLLFLQSETT